MWGSVYTLSATRRAPSSRARAHAPPPRPPPAAPSVEETRKRQREAAESAAAEEAARPAVHSKRQRREGGAALREAPDRLARTLFVGNVPLAASRKRLSSIFVRHLAAARAAGSLPPLAPAEAEAEEAEEGEEEEEEEEDGAETGLKQKGEKKKGKGGDVESVRFRSVPIAKVAVAPGSSYKGMIRAAVATGARDGGAAAVQHAYIVMRSVGAAEACLALNGVAEVDGHTLRVDRAAGGSAASTGGGGLDAGVGARYDPKRTVFVGNLPFEAGEEAVRAHFAAALAGGAAAIDSVRIVRDRVTHKGRGIAFLLFRERLSVAEALGLSGTPFAGRDLRVTRCGAQGAAGAPSSAPGGGGKAARAALPKHMGERAETRVKAKPAKPQRGAPQPKGRAGRLSGAAARLAKRK
jgi:hypothetical protein